MSEVQRRRVVQGAAWAVPTIIVGAAVPMAAASPPPPPEFSDTPKSGCKEPGQSQNIDWGYHVVFTLTASVSGTLCFTGVDAPGDPSATPIRLEVAGQTPGQCVELVGGVPTDVEFVFGASNSANGTATLYVSFEGGEAVSPEFSFSGFNPCKK